MLRVPLAVRLVSAAGDKYVTRRLRDLGFRIVVPGGFAAAALSFDQPLATTDPAVEIYGKVYIVDGRTGRILWEGRQEDPGRGASGDGQIWTLNCFGPSALAADNPLTVCYIDNGTEAWQSSPRGLKVAQVSSIDDDPPVVHVQLPNGTIAANGDFGQAINRLVADCGQKLARVSAVWSTGVTDANYSVRIHTHDVFTGTLTVAATATLNTAGGTLAARITTDIPVGDDLAFFSIVHTAAAATVLDDNHWITGQLVVQGTRYTAAGVEQTAAATYTADTVLASDIVADLLGRVLTGFDGATASIDVTAFPIDRLVYPDPVPPTQIFDDLMALEEAYYWAAWESTANGKYRFEWKAWPSTVRYETSITDDFDSPGSVGDLYNKVIVRYRDRNGRSRTVTRTLAQTDLDNAGLTRTATIDLGDNIGSAANAAQAGDAYLADHNSPPNAGTLAINRPVLDLVWGRMVQPWEIVPGELIRVRGVLPRIDALNATDRDAVTVFRLISTDYTASTNTCTAGLDSYSRSMANEVFAAHKRIDQLRKR